MVGPYSPDYVDAEHRLVVQLDLHWQHWSVAKRAVSDDKRDAALLAAGYRTIRVYPWDLKDRAALAQRIAAAVEAR
jgi:very-short-patch-repair endonuclease